MIVYPAIWILVILLTSNWLMCICTPPGIIVDNMDLTEEEIKEIKRDSKSTKERELTIKKYLSIDPLSFKLPFEPIPEYENEYRGRSIKQLRAALSQSIYSNVEKYSYCTTCRLIRPPRAHHCKVYGRCVDRMDHWCPWVANTVGRRNHKFFILFTLYASTALLIASFLEASSFYFIDSERVG